MTNFGNSSNLPIMVHKHLLANMEVTKNGTHSPPGNIPKNNLAINQFTTAIDSRLEYYANIHQLSQLLSMIITHNMVFLLEMVYIVIKINWAPIWWEHIIGE